MWHAEKGPLVILSSRALSLPLRAGSSPFHILDTGPFAEKALHKPLCNSPSRFNMCAWDSVGCEPCALALPNAGLGLAFASVSEMVNAPAQMQPFWRSNPEGFATSKPCRYLHCRRTPVPLHHQELWAMLELFRGCSGFAAEICLNPTVLLL